MRNQADIKGVTLLRAFLLCMSGVGALFVLLTLVVLIFSTDMLNREQSMVSGHLPDQDVAYQIAAATAGLQAQGLLLGSSSSVGELELLSERLNAKITDINDATLRLSTRYTDVRSSLMDEINLTGLVAVQIVSLKQHELFLQENIESERQVVLDVLTQIDKNIKNIIRDLTDSLVTGTNALAQFDPETSNNTNALIAFTDNVFEYDTLNVAIQDYLMLSQDLALLAAVVERVPLLQERGDVVKARQNRDLLINALVTRSVYINDKENAKALLLSLRDARQRLRASDNIFDLQFAALIQAALQDDQTQQMQELTARILEQSEALRTDSRVAVNSLANISLAAIEKYRLILLALCLFALLAIALISYWLVYKKTVMPLQEIAQGLSNVGNPDYPKQSKHYFLQELSTLSFAMFQLDQAQKGMRRQDAQLQLINRELLQANSDLKQFAHVASHDLQEPLRKLQQFSDLLEEDYGEAIDDDGKFFLKTIRSSAQRMSMLIKETLAYSLVGSTNQSIEAVDLNVLLLQLKEEIAIAQEEAQGEFIIEPLPIVIANTVGVAQLFRNLMTNALKYSKPGTPATVKISVNGSTERLPGHLNIRVEDNGVGIDEKHHERIFTPFERVHIEGTRGTGLGLAICKKVCDAHDWSISVSSELDKGTAFDIQLPVNDIHETKAA